MMSSSLFSTFLFAGFLSITMIITILLVSNHHLFVTGMYKVPDLAHDKRCPACVSFAVALRRASWEAHPPHQLTDKKMRKKLLNSDNRCQELLTEAMDVVLTRQAFVYFVPGTVPPTDREDLWTEEGANDHILLYFNKTDAPKNAVGRFWSLQDLYLHRRLQVSDFQVIAETVSKNADQSLMHFMHDELREALGDETEALCYLDLFHTSGNNVTKDDFMSEPAGMLALKDFSQHGKAFDLDAEWLSLNVLKDRKKDEKKSLEWANKLCKDLCKKDAEKTSNLKLIGGSSGSANNVKKLDKKQKLKNFIHSNFPIHPPQVKAKDFSNDPEKAHGEFSVPDRFPQAVDPQEMHEKMEKLSKDGISVERKVSLDSSSSNDDEKPLVEEDY